MAIGYVLITILPKHEKTVLFRLSRVKEIVEMYTVFGEYDVVAKVEARNLDILGDIVVEKIRSIHGVKDTKTQLVTVL